MKLRGSTEETEDGDAKKAKTTVIDNNTTWKTTKIDYNRINI